MAINFTAGVGFEWTTEQGDAILLKYEFPEPKFQVAPHDNIVFELWASEHVESQVFPITFDSGKTCGWLCTASALTSAELNVEWRENEHFRTAAWAIARYLVEKYRPKIEADATRENRYEFGLDQCLDGELSVMTLHFPGVPKRIQEKPSVLIPKLLQMGLVPYIDVNSKAVVRPKFVPNSQVLNISTDFPSHNFQEFYNDLLLRYIPSANDMAFKFYLYYQIIESMMEDVLVATAKVVLGDLTTAQGNVVAIRDSLDKFQKISSEIARIKKVFAVLPLASCCNLRESCMAFLETTDQTFHRGEHANEEVAFFVYKTRNQLIHNFRRMQNGRTQLEEVIRCFEELVPELICTFGTTRPS